MPMRFPPPPMPCVGGFQAGDVAGPGNATHLGNTAFFFHTASCATDFGAETLTLMGALTLTGANGDAISADATVIFDLSGVLVGGQFGALVVTGTVTGGTGRFAGATGVVSATGVQDFFNGAGTFTLDGTVSSVGSLK